MITQIAISFVAGIVSFLSPCVLPLVPVYVGFISGVSIQKSDEVAGNRRRILLTTLLFVLGFSLIFILLGLVATSVGSFLQKYRTLISQIGGLAIIILGLHFMGAFRIGLLLREKRIDAGRQWMPGSATAFLTGMVFAFGWTPCIGPILAAILILASQAGAMARGIVLLTSYSLGLGIPFILVALAAHEAMTRLNALKRRLRTVEIAGGVLLVIVGGLLLADQMQRLSNFVAHIPGIACLDSIQVNAELEPATTPQPAPAPDVPGAVEATMKTLDGKTVHISDYRGKIVMLNYWATYCTPCKEEMPILSQFQERYRDKGVVILGITTGYESVSQVKDIIKTHGATYPVFLVDKTTLSAVPYFQGVPTSFLLDRQGRIAAKPFNEVRKIEKLEEKFAPLLKENAQ